MLHRALRDVDCPHIADPLTGTEAGEEPKAAVTKVRVNNTLRRVIRDLLGTLTLGSDDPPYFGATIGGEYAVARERFGLEEGELSQITRTAVQGSFADDAVKDAALARLGFDGRRGTE